MVTSLNTANQKVRLCLELNENSISEAVTNYIHYKVQELAKQKSVDEELLEAVHRHLLTNAHGTFLWVALVCEELRKGKARNTHKLLNAFPAGLDPLYERMMKRIQDSEDAEDAELCKRILAVVTIVYRPITLEELPALVKIPDHVSRKDQHLADLIADCGSFLSLRGRIVSLVHQSATDFLLRDASNEKFSVFPRGVKAKHQEICLRSLQAISETLRRDIYNIKYSGFPIEQVREPDPDPLAIARYSCVYWVDHLKDYDSPHTDKILQEGGAVDNFLRQKYLHWIEALSLLRSLSKGIAAIVKLDSLLQVIDWNHLHTSVGTFNLENVVPMKTSLDRSAPPYFSGYGFNDDRSWMVYEGKNLLWLPSECRPVVFSSSIIPSIMAIGCSSGLVLIFNFSRESPVIIRQTSERLFKPGGQRTRTIFSHLFRRT
ncbi:hypothetical protein F1880_006681 [Penicillium rolfsii]|nr:hypothetical protein F1880_006681 [Penicillium rolfsii]